VRIRKGDIKRMGHGKNGRREMWELGTERTLKISRFVPARWRSRNLRAGVNIVVGLYIVVGRSTTLAQPISNARIAAMSKRGGREMVMILTLNVPQLGRFDWCTTFLNTDDRR
jgi:hypothetical protein